MKLSPAPLFLFLVLPLPGTVVIDWTTVGNPGNAAQSSSNRTHSQAGGDGFGGVAETFLISRNETTISQYAAFLNAVAAADPYGLYNPNMESNANVAGISRSGSSGSYSYSVIGSGDRPVTYVSWFDAARFTNWLHNGQGSGDTETGVYTLVGGQVSGMVPGRNAGAQVWIPTENEWYKAAYYDPAHMGGAGGYWLQANRSNSMPGNDPLEAGSANYFDGDYAATQSGDFDSGLNYLSDVGAYGAASRSYFGINDMAGNVSEWNDLNAQSGELRGLRGGDWQSYDFYLRSSLRIDSDPAVESDFVGFRVAAVPEPGSVLLGGLSALLFAFRRRR